MNRSWRPAYIFVLTISLLVAAKAVGPATPLRGAAGEFQLQAQSPQFWTLLDRDAKLSLVATGFGFTEGPVWDEA
jgi:gluconolactonase